MKAPASPRIHHHVDPMRYPKVQKEYEGKGRMRSTLLNCSETLLKLWLKYKRRKDNVIHGR